MATDVRPESPIRKARLDKGLLLIDAAAEANVSPGYLSMIENGYRPKAKVRERIATALDSTPAVLWPEVG